MRYNLSKIPKFLFSSNRNLSALTGRIPFFLRVLKSFKKGFAGICYHSVSNRSDMPSSNIRIEDFRQQVKYFNKHFKIIKSDDLIFNLKNNIKPEGIELVITFDDGQLNNYNYAYPILKELSIPATFFVTIKRIENGFENKTLHSMGWDHIKEISRDNLFTIGSHTISHPDLPTLQSHEIRTELKESKKILEERLSTEIKSVAYPYGRYDERVLRIARKVGFKLGVSTDCRIETGKPHQYKFGRFFNMQFVFKQV